MLSLIDARNSHTIRRDFVGIAFFVGAIWVVFVLDRFLPLEQLGLVPRTGRGIIGIVAMPFLHGDFNHLLSNTIPLIITLMLLAGSRANSGAIVALIIVFGGLGLWLFGRTALHIGASGLVFGLIAFHLFAGLFERRLQSVIIGVGVALLYSTTLMKGIVPFQHGVSWDGHLLGAIAGALVALLIARRLREQTATATATQGARRV